jgi:transglutaminase-like putative cysteine protease/tetratricopeptide (TPR) repeat protein
LYQFRLIAVDLADTPVFITSLLAAFAAAVFLSGRCSLGGKPGPLAAVIAIGLIPWITRIFIALPGFFIPGRTDALAVTLDSLLLNLDRNNFVSLLPFYWAAVTSWFSIRSRKFLRAAVIADAALLLVVFSIARTADIQVYRWPVVMIFLFAGIVFVQALALLFSLPPETRLRKSEAIPAIAALLALIILGGILFLKPSQERAIEKGGGLLEPKLFSFDFSQFLRLDSEISMSDDLVLIVKKDRDDDHILLRRSVLSGYSRKQGFYRIEELDERTHPQRLPERPARLSGQPASAGDEQAGTSPVRRARQLRQEYFLVNFDAAAFIAMNEPVLVTPYESWDASSFSSAYAVESMVSSAVFAELSLAATGRPGAAELGLTEHEFKLYTDYGGDERIRAYAGEITRGLDHYGDKVRMIHDWLKYGEYRYSLKPGIAPDGDQLAWFLFQSKKGYCSYYAFSMALMLRSLGIPARVAAGFFIDPAANTFDYYPVRSDMAHAWVEVPFPGYGWIEYDPTSENLSEDEDFRFSAGVDPDLFERLMREILENRSRLRVREGQEGPDVHSDTNSLARSAAALLRDYALPLLFILLAAFFIYIRCGCLIASVLRRDNRKKAILLWKHTRRRLRLAGLKRAAGLPESEWALGMDHYTAGIYALYQGMARARFAPAYTDDDFSSQRNAYRVFSAAYGKQVSLCRRLAAWLLPPLALIPGPKKGGGSAPLLMLLIFIALAGSETKAQNNEENGFSAADELYMDATEAEFAEFWERAIELFKEGNVRYPHDPRFPWALGNLYYSRSLYGLAWEEYRKAEAISPFNTDILLRLANTAGYLNLDQRSVEYYERILTLDPDNKEAIGSLGWMYYKVHRLGDGEQILSAALERFGDDPDMSMTLGTVYSDMYQYDKGKYWYQQAIDLGEALGDRYFTAVAYYNLSILESRFYRFDFSMDATNASLNAQNRASGRLARGELYLRQLDLERSQRDYETAYETDTSPLAKLNLAQVYQISGRLEEARLYAEDCLKGSDLSWMLHFGIDSNRYKRDIHDILYKTYTGLTETERFMPWGRTGEKIRSFFRSISFRFKAEVHQRLYRKYSLAAADAYGTAMYEGGGPHIESFSQYYNAFEGYPRRALGYLNKARELESSLIPAAKPSYDLEEGLLLKNKVLWEKAFAGLDPLWEREMIAQCYKEFALSGNAAGLAKAARQAAAEELFVLNRGALRQAGIALPVEIRVVSGGENGALNFRRNERTLLKALAKAGLTPAGNAGLPARFKLSIRVSGSAAAGYTASCELVDSAGAGTTQRHSIPVHSLSGADMYDFARALGGVVFMVE